MSTPPRRLRTASATAQPSAVAISAATNRSASWDAFDGPAFVPDNRIIGKVRGEGKLERFDRALGARSVPQSIDGRFDSQTIFADALLRIANRRHKLRAGGFGRADAVYQQIPAV